MSYYTLLNNPVFNDFNENANIQIGNEVALVGAASGGGFDNTAELRVMKYKEAMSTNDANEWKKSVHDEWKRFERHHVFKKVPREEVEPGAKFVSTTWAMKKSNGTYRARMNMRGYEQIDGQHYDSASILSPVTNDITIRIVLVLMVMADLYGYMSDVKGAFLHGVFEDGETIYTEVPEGFDEFVDRNKYVLMLLRSVYGLRQAGKLFWKELLKAMSYMFYRRHKVDPCLYFKWHEVFGLILWLSWVDDCLNVGKKELVLKESEKLHSLFDCDDVGEMEEYVGCMLERNTDEGWIKITQPITIQSFEDEFNLSEFKKPITTPGEPGKVLTAATDEDKVENRLQYLFRKGTGKLLHLTRWSRAEIGNAVRDLSRRMQMSNAEHNVAMRRAMKYCVDTKERGWLLKPTRKWDGKDKSFEFKVSGRSDSDYANCPTTRKSVTGYRVSLEDAPVAVKSGLQKIVSLSTAEAELIAAVQCAQEMLYVMRILEGMELKVKKPMILDTDNKSTYDIVNSYGPTPGTKHIQVRYLFLRELQENGIIKMRWIPGGTNDSDLFTKNLDRPTFEKHAKYFVGDDKYMNK